MIRQQVLYFVSFCYLVFNIVNCDIKPGSEGFSTDVVEKDFFTADQITEAKQVEIEKKITCLPGERICSFFDVLVCKLDGSDFVFLKNCPSGCENGDCIKEEEKKDPTLYDDIDFWPQEYNVSGLTWDHSPVTYCFENFTSDLPQDKIIYSIKKAFNLWAEHIPFVFELEDCNSAWEPDIKIRFGVGDHGGCKSSFDGPGKVLAHAFYPGNWSNGGDVHFDDAEKWTFNLPIPSGEYDLVTVAAHELGHSLGLQHSFVKTALMYNTYSGEHRYLDPDDIAGIEALYPTALPYPCYDNDKDGYGINKTNACSNSGIDCNDDDKSIHPGALEVCDKKDNNCNGLTDEDPKYWNMNCGSCIDMDGDGYGKNGTNIIACLGNKFDCDDTDADVYPGAIEFCDGKDNNCNGLVDEDPKFYNNCGKCGPDEIGVGSPCGKCGVIKCKPGGGVMCDEPCPAGQSCCGDGCMPDGGDCCTEKGLWEGSCTSGYKCIPGEKCVLKKSVSCGNDCYCNPSEVCCKGYCAPNGYKCCPPEDFSYPENCYQKGACPVGSGCTMTKYQFPWVYLFCCFSQNDCIDAIELYKLPKQTCPNPVKDVPVFPDGCL